MEARRSPSLSPPSAASLATLAKLGERGDEDACLDYLRDLRFPDGTACPGCGQATRFHRVRGRSAYACQYCRHHVYPTAQTIFRRSTTPLSSWFGAIVLVNSNQGASTVAELGRELRVARKTAVRMLALIRLLVHDGDEAMLAAPGPPALTPGPTAGDQADPPLARDRLREELSASLVGLRGELREAEARATAASAEVQALRTTIVNVENLIGFDPAG